MMGLLPDPLPCAEHRRVFLPWPAACVFNATNIPVEHFSPLTSMAMARIRPLKSSVCAGFPEETAHTLRRFPAHDFPSTRH